MRILNDPITYISKNHVAKNMLATFIIDYAQIYGERFVTPNIHMLSHLADAVMYTKRPLEEFSAFPFESYICKLKNYIKSHHKPLQQLVKRLDEEFKASDIVSIKIPKKKPILQLMYSLAGNEYNKIFYYGIKLSFDFQNKFVLTKDKNIIEITKFKKINEAIFVQGKQFKKIEDYYLYPVKSSYLDIYKSEKSYKDEQVIINIQELDRKLFAMEYSNEDPYYIFFPLTRFSLNHTSYT